MGFGVGILLLVIGLILTLGAVDLPSAVTDVVNADVIGWICLIVGALAIVLVLVTNQQRSKTTHVEERRENL
jgi:fumarate reductase subunit D